METTQEQGTTATAETKRRGNRKVRVGRVVSNAHNKTIVVETVKPVAHPRFRKVIKQTKKFHAHDEKNEAKTGDQVRIAETRPLSRMKRWRLVEILKH